MRETMAPQRSGSSLALDRIQVEEALIMEAEEEDPGAVAAGWCASGSTSEPRKQQEKQIVDLSLSMDSDRGAESKLDWRSSGVDYRPQEWKRGVGLGTRGYG